MKLYIDVGNTATKIFFDDNGNEYIENYLTPTYAKKKNILLENAKEMLALGQFTHQQKSINEMDELVDEALAAIDIYNHDESLTSLYGEIEFPIYFDYYTNNENMTYSVFGTNKTFNTNTIESNLIQSVNNRINKICHLLFTLCVHTGTHLFPF